MSDCSSAVHASQCEEDEGCTYAATGGAGDPAARECVPRDPTDRSEGGGGRDTPPSLCEFGYNTFAWECYGRDMSRVCTPLASDAPRCTATRGCVHDEVAGACNIDRGRDVDDAVANNQWCASDVQRPARICALRDLAGDVCVAQCVGAARYKACMFDAARGRCVARPDGWQWSNGGAGTPYIPNHSKNSGGRRMQSFVEVEEWGAWLAPLFMLLAISCKYLRSRNNKATATHVTKEE